MDRKDELKALRAGLRAAFAENEDMPMDSLLALLLSYSEKDAFDTASQRLLDVFGTLAPVCDSDPHTLMRSFGISEQSAVLLRLITIISRNMAIEGRKIKRFDSADAAKRYFISYFIGADIEHAAAAALGSDLSLRGVRTVAEGTFSRVEMDVRSIIEHAINCDSSDIIIAHCHPHSGCEPSEKDRITTRCLIERAGALGIRLLDHIIVGSGQAVSMRESTELFEDVNAGGYRYTRAEGEVQKICKK